MRPTGIIKRSPEHFMVQEANGRIVQPVYETKITGAQSHITAFTLTKRGIPAEAAYREVAKQLGVSRESVTAYGMKDAVAVTAQTIVVEGNFDPKFEHNKIWLHQQGPAKQRLRNGGHQGNRFIILVETTAEIPPRLPQFRNLFGPQRFGEGRVNIGRFLLEGDFEACCPLMRGTRNWSNLERIMGRDDSIKGFVAALLSERFRSQREFLINQWLSWLWNQAARESSEKSLPLWSLESVDLYRKWWNPRDLDAKMLEHMHQFIRPVWVETRNHQVIQREAGHEHSFTLGSGSYATVFLAAMYDLRDASVKRPCPVS